MFAVYDDAEHYDDIGGRSGIMFVVCEDAEPLEVACEAR